MSDLQKNWIAPILTGLIATVLGGLMLLPLVSPAKMDEAPTGVALKDNSNSVFPTLLAPQWEPLANEASYARNYSRLAKLPYERFPQVVTIYETPMATDRRNGREISPGEYVEIFKVGEPTDVVILVRLDKGRYWLLSRQRISLSDWPALSSIDPEASDANFLKFQYALQNVIDTTRHVLRVAL